jgi:(2Fe-2S) ferredoxin
VALDGEEGFEPARIWQREVDQSDVKGIADQQIQGGQESVRLLNLKDLVVYVRQ